MFPNNDTKVNIITVNTIELTIANPNINGIFAGFTPNIYISPKTTITVWINDIVKNNNILPKCFWRRFNFVPSSKSSHSAVNNDVSNNEPTQIAKVV